MSPPLKPTGLKPEFLRECLDVLSDDPPTLRWRVRPRSHFPSEVICRTWNKSNAGQVLRPQKDGRLRLGLVRQVFDARAIVAEIGVTPIGDLQWGARGVAERPSRRHTGARWRRTARRRHASRHGRDRAPDGRPDGHER
jgi:hypothetical protein